MLKLMFMYLSVGEFCLGEKKGGAKKFPFIAGVLH